MSDEPQNTPQQPYFENQADFNYKIIDPDSKYYFQGLTELNKDLVTTNLNNAEIMIASYNSSIIGECNELNDILKSFKTKMVRELMMLVNVTKSRDGFMLKQMTEQRISRTDKFEQGKIKPKEVGK